MPRRPTRRDFIQGSAAATAMLASGRLGALAAAAADTGSGFNNGRSQINFNFAQFSGEYPFINHLKAAQSWNAGSGGGTVPPDTLNANGYPISIVQGGVYTVFYIPTEAQRPGNWRLRWTGTGTVVLNGPGGGGGTATNGDYTLMPPVTPSQGGNRIDLRINGGTNITNIEFFHEDDEALIDAGQVFNTKFLDTLRG